MGGGRGKPSLSLLVDPHTNVLGLDKPRKTRFDQPERSAGGANVDGESRKVLMVL